MRYVNSTRMIKTKRNIYTKNDFQPKCNDNFFRKYLVPSIITSISSVIVAIIISVFNLIAINKQIYNQNDSSIISYKNQIAAEHEKIDFIRKQDVKKSVNFLIKDINTSITIITKIINAIKPYNDNEFIYHVNETSPDSFVSINVIRESMKYVPYDEIKNINNSAGAKCILFYKSLLSDSIVIDGFENKNSGTYNFNGISENKNKEIAMMSIASRNAMICIFLYRDILIGLQAIESLEELSDDNSLTLIKNIIKIYDDKLDDMVKHSKDLSIKIHELSNGNN